MPRKKKAIDDTQLRSIARGYTNLAISVLGGIAKDGENEGARVSACAQLLDRGWGRPAQPITGKDGEEDIRVTIRTIIGKPE
jgi:hypothetical protein